MFDLPKWNSEHKNKKIPVSEALKFVNLPLSELIQERKKA